MRIKPLPPLNALVAFEAAGRHLSFTLAAEELNVTQGAISRQIRLLEEFLNAPLFIRASRSISLTPTGAQYHQDVRGALLEIAQSTGDIRHWQGDRQVTVATSAAIASMWLLPKVAEFQREHEDVDLRIIASDVGPDLRHLNCDLALYYCSSPPAGIKVTPLFQEEVFPTCSPRYLERFGPITDPADLVSRTLLVLEDAPHDWMTWNEWFRHLGLKPGDARRKVHINSYPMLIQACANGQGVALAWRHLIDDYLSSGSLVPAGDAVVRTEASFSMLEPPQRRAARLHIDRFRQWLLDSLPVADGLRTPPASA